MNKFLVRLFVACTCFVLSVGLTNLSKFFRGGDTVALEDMPAIVDFNEDEIAIRAIYSEYGPAQTRHDRTFFESVETDNFMLFLRGQRISREEDIQSMETWPADVVFESKPEYIRIFGNSAVVRGRMKACYGDGYSAYWPFIDVWVKRGGMWRIQSTTSPD